MKLLTYTNGIRIAFFATFLLLVSLNLSAQYKLELGWATEPGGGGFNISSIINSADDSLVYVSGGVFIDNKSEYYIHTCKSSDGTLIRTDSADASYKMIMSKDRKTLAAAGGFGVGLLDPQTFKRVYWEENANSDYTTLTFNEVQRKVTICGNSLSNNPISSFIKVYDLEKKQLHKAFNPSYFGQHSNLIKKAMLTDDGKYIIYSYVTNVPNWKNYLLMIDLDGNVVKNFGETSSTNFSLTNEGKTLIYFMPNAIHFFDIETMKEMEGISLGKIDPMGIDMSNDGKVMILGVGPGLAYCDLETKKAFYLADNGAWQIFKLNNDNSSLFFALSRDLYRLNLKPTSSIIATKNILELSINVIDNKLILTNPQNQQINTLTAYDILARTYPLSANGNEVDVSSLAAGRYFLKVGLADGSFLDFGFVKE